MSVLGWFGILLSLVGVILVGVGSYLSYEDRDNLTSSQRAFYFTLGGALAFFLGWILFAFYLFMTKQLDLTPQTVEQAKQLLPDPDEMRKVFAESTDDQFANILGVQPTQVPK